MNKFLIIAVLTLAIVRAQDDEFFDEDDESPYIQVSVSIATVLDGYSKKF